jgi:hypothetical protein
VLQIPLLKPSLPDAHTLLPYLQRVDNSHWYTNFGTLENEFLNKLLSKQQTLDENEVFGVLTSNATLGIELALTALWHSPKPVDTFHSAV